MRDIPLPQPLAPLLDTLSGMLDRRHADLLEPLFLGQLLATGRRTATAWFRGGGITTDFRRGYTLLGTLGRSWTRTIAGFLFRDLRQTINPGKHWLFALDDTPTVRYGPCVEGAGIHHNPTPGPVQQRYLYGHIWVTCAWVVRHPLWDTLALPLCADLYIRATDLPTIPADHRPPFATKLEQAAGQIAWLDTQLEDRTIPLWIVGDGAFAKRPIIQAVRQAKAVLVSRLPKNAALYDLPPKIPKGQRRGRGRPRIYGRNRISLAKRAGHQGGWEQVECFQYQKTVTKTIKTFLATWKPAGGVIRVVRVREDDGWRAYFSTDPNASVADILEAAAGRTSLEQTFKDEKEVEGAGQQQLRYGPANVAAYHWCLWGYTAVEWWAWDKAAATVCDRSASPWDQEERRPSHADKRKALQGEMLEREFWRRWGDRPCPPKIRELIEAVLALAA